jgi:hypothetical protein
MVPAPRSTADGFYSRKYSTILRSHRWLRASSEFSLGAKDLVYLLTYSFVRDEHSAVQRCQTFFDLLPKPLIVVEVGCDQFLEDLIRAFPSLRSGQLELGL